jgi:multidrug resistance protein, MATE family
MSQTRLTFNRADLRQLLDISLPMVVSQGSFAAMVFADRLFLSLIDPLHMAAAMGGGVAAFFTIALFQGVMAYANALVAQYYGAGDFSKCPRVVTQGLIMALLCLPVIAGVAFYVDQLFEAMGHEPEQVVLEQAYYRILMLGTLFNLSKACIASYFSGIGRTRVVMMADVSGVLLNIPLSYVLVFGVWGFPELGIEGAAWGTVIATLFALVIFAGFYLSKDHRTQFSVAKSLQFDNGIMRRYVRLGFPSGLEMFMNVATFNLFLLLFQSFGITYGAAAAIVFNWDMISFVPMIGLHIGIMSLVGRYVGANDMSRVNGVMTAGFTLALGYSFILATLFVIFRVDLINVFSGSGADFQEIIEIGSFMMVGLACYMMADALILITGAVLRGAGDTRWLMITSISLHWLMLIVQVIMIRGMDFGPKPSWIAFVISIILIAVAYLWRLAGGVWRQPERLAAVMQE